MVLFNQELTREQLRKLSFDIDPSPSVDTDRMRDLTFGTPSTSPGVSSEKLRELTYGIEGESASEFEASRLPSSVPETDLYDFYPPRPEPEDEIDDISRIRSGQKAVGSTFDRTDIFLPAGIREFSVVYDRIMESGMNRVQARDEAYQVVLDGNHMPIDRSEAISFDPFLEASLDPGYQSAEAMEKGLHQIREFRAERSKVLGSFLNTLTFRTPELVMDSIGLGNWWRNQISPETTGGKAAQTIGDLAALITGPFKAVRAVGKKTPLIRSFYSALDAKGKASLISKGTQRFFQTAYELGSVAALSEHGGLSDLDIGANLVSRYKEFKSAIPAAGVFAVVGQIAPKNKAVGQILRQSIGRAMMSTMQYYLASGTGPKSQEGYKEFLKEQFNEENMWDTMLHWGIDVYFFRHGVSNKDLLKADGSQIKLLELQQEISKRNKKNLVDTLKAVNKLKKEAGHPPILGTKLAGATYEDIISWQKAWYNDMTPVQKRIWEDLNTTNRGKQLVNIVRDVVLQSEEGMSIGKREPEQDFTERSAMTSISPDSERALIRWSATEEGNKTIQDLLKLRYEPDKAAEVVDRLLDGFVGIGRLEQVTPEEAKIIEDKFAQPDVPSTKRADPEVLGTLLNVVRTAQGQRLEAKKWAKEQQEIEEVEHESGRLSDLVQEREPDRALTSAEKLANIIKTGMSFKSQAVRTELRAGQYREDRTNLLNRKGMNRILEEGTKRASTLNKSLTLWSMDLDNFKMINDNFGMEMGDGVLQIVADVLTEASYDTQVGLRGVISKPGRPNIGDEFEIASHLSREQSETLVLKAEEIFNKEITERIEELLGKKAKKKGITLPRVELSIGTHTIPAEEIHQYVGKIKSDGKLDVLASVSRLRQESETVLKRKKRAKKEVLGEEDRGRIIEEYKKKVDSPTKVLSSDSVPEIESQRLTTDDIRKHDTDYVNFAGNSWLKNYRESEDGSTLTFNKPKRRTQKQKDEGFIIHRDVVIEFRGHEFTVDRIRDNYFTLVRGDRITKVPREEVGTNFDVDAEREIEIWSKDGSKIPLLTLQERNDLEVSGNLQAHREELVRSYADADLINRAKNAKKDHMVISDSATDRAFAEAMLKEIEGRGYDLNTLKKFRGPPKASRATGILNKVTEIKTGGSVDAPAIDGSPSRLVPGTIFSYLGQDYVFRGKGKISILPMKGTTLENIDKAMGDVGDVSERILSGDFREFTNFRRPSEIDKAETEAKRAKIEAETKVPPPKPSEEVAQNSNMEADDFIATQVSEMPDTMFKELVTEEHERQDLVDLMSTQYDELQESHEKDWGRKKDDDGILDFMGTSHFIRTFKGFSKAIGETAKAVTGIEGVHYPDQKDLKEMWSLLQTPEDVGRSFPAMGAVYDVADAQSKLGSDLLHQMVGSPEKDGPLTYFVDPKYLSEGDSIAVNKALGIEYYTDKLLPKEKLLAPIKEGGYGFNAAQLRAYEGVREFFNKMAPTMLYELAVEMQMDATRKGSSIPNFDPQVFLDYMSNNPAYLASMRYGEWYLKIRPLEPGSRTAENPDGKPVKGSKSSFFEMHENAPRLFRGATVQQRLFGSLRSDVGMAEKFVDQLTFFGKTKAQTQLNRLKKSIYPADKFHYEIDKTTQLDSSFYEDIPLIKIEAAIRNATMPEDIADAAVKGVRRVLMARGFAAHMLPKAGIPGVYRDFRRSSLDYAAKLSTYLAKMRAMPKYSDALAKIDAKRQPNLYRYSSRYIKYFLLPTSPLEMAPLRGLLFDWLISGKISSAVLNATANIIFATPLLGMHLQGNAVSRIAKSRTMILKAMEEVVSHNAGVEGVLNAEEADAIAKGLKQADISAQLMEDIIGLQRGHLRLPGMKGWGIRDALRTPFAFVERVLNREATMLAFYRTFRAKGVDHDVAIAQSVKWVENAHFRYGRHNRPRMGRGIGAPILVFKSFLIQAVQLQKNLIMGKYADPTAGISRMRQWQAFGETMASMMALGGFMSLPFIDEMKDFFLAMWGIDIEEQMRRGIQRATSQKDTAFMEQMLMRGLPASLPEKYAWDMSGPIGLDIVPIELRPRGGRLLDVGNLVSDLAGAPSIIWQRGWAAKEAMDQERGSVTAPFLNSYEIDARYYLLFEQLSPDFIRNGLRAWRLREEGALTRGGKMIYDPKTHKRYKLSDFQMIMKALGFQPREMNAIYDYMVAMEAIQSQYTRAKSRFTKQWASALARNNREDMNEVNADVREWNNEHKGDPSMQIQITRSDIINRLGAGMFPTKRAYQLYLRRMETYQ